LRDAEALRGRIALKIEHGATQHPRVGEGRFSARDGVGGRRGIDIIRTGPTGRIARPN
jgi:hypothetical protein